MGGLEWRVSTVALGRFAAPLNEVVLGRFGAPTGAGATSHAFRRATDGQWYLTGLAAPNWQPAQSSSIPLRKLRFGDFTGDGVTDVLAVQGGRWSISQSATGSWQTLNARLSQDIEPLVIADVDNDHRDDILRFEKTGATTLTCWVSWGGRTDWTRYTTVNGLALTKTGTGNVPTALPLYAFAGQFDTTPGADLLVVDSTRIGRFTSRNQSSWKSQYNY